MDDLDSRLPRLDALKGLSRCSTHKRIDDSDFLRIIADCLLNSGTVELEDTDLLRFEVIATKLEKRRSRKRRATKQERETT